MVCTGTLGGPCVTNGLMFPSHWFWLKVVFLYVCLYVFLRHAWGAVRDQRSNFSLALFLVYICMYVCIYIYIYMYTYVYIIQYI
jgi:hypothetical protein